MAASAPLDIDYLRPVLKLGCAALNPLFFSDEAHEEIFKAERHRLYLEQVPSVLYDAGGKRRADFVAMASREGDE